MDHIKWARQKIMNAHQSRPSIKACAIYNYIIPTKWFDDIDLDRNPSISNDEISNE